MLKFEIEVVAFKTVWLLKLSGWLNNRNTYLQVYQMLRIFIIPAIEVWLTDEDPIQQAESAADTLTTQALSW